MAWTFHRALESGSGYPGNGADMKSRIIITLYLILAVLSLKAYGESPGRQQETGRGTPWLIMAYQETFCVASQLSDRLWVENVPYEKVPVLAYDLASKEEYLINFPKPAPSGYAPTPYRINEKPVYRKIGDLTLKYPGGQACRLIDGIPVVTMGYGSDTPLILIVQAFLHEGFHFFQMSSVYAAGIQDMMQFPGKSPRNEAFDADLVVEGKLLYDLTAESKKDSKPVVIDLIRRLAAVESFRKKKLPLNWNRGEDLTFLLEGTATFVELKALSILGQEKPKKTTIPENCSVKNLSISRESAADIFTANSRHFGPEMLKNKINYPSTSIGEIQYRYALALVRVLQSWCAENGTNWTAGMFPLIPPDLSGEKAKAAFLQKIDNGNLSRRLLDLVKLSDADASSCYRDTMSRYLSQEERQLIAEKVHIEKNLDRFPFEDGWTYRVNAKKFILTYFDWITGTSYADESIQKVAYIRGLDKLATSDKSMEIEGISIPVIVEMFRGLVRFKDVGRSDRDAQWDYGEKSGDTYKSLKLEIHGLKLRARNARVLIDPCRKETKIELQ